MAYTLREAISGTNSLDSFEAFSGPAGNYTGGGAVSCNDEMIAGLTAIKGAGAFVQGAAGTLPTGPAFTSISQAFASDNTAGNCIIVDTVFRYNATITEFTASDTQGNVYIPTVATGIAGGQIVGGQLVAFGINGGPNTVTVTARFLGTPQPGFEPCILIHEYVDGASVDTFAQGIQFTVGRIDLAVNTTSNDELLHLFFGIVTACPGSPDAITGPAISPPEGGVVAATFTSLWGSGHIGGGTI